MPPTATKPEDDDPLAPSYRSSTSTTPTTPPPAALPDQLSPSFAPQTPDAPPMEGETPTRPTPNPAPSDPTPPAATAPGGINPTTGTLMGGGTATPGGNPNFNENSGPQGPSVGTPYDSLVSSVQGASNPQDASAAQDQLARTLSTDLTAAGHTVKWNDDGTVTVDGRPYVLAGAAAPAPVAPAFAPTAPGYTPAPVDPLTDFNANAGNEPLDAATQAAIARLLQPGGGAVDQATQASVLALLQHPSNVNPDELKAKNREEQAAMAQGQDENLLRFGFQTGTDDSNFLASERASNLRNRDDAIIKGNRDVDITAGAQQTEDQRAAIGVGASFGAQQASRDQGAVQASQSYQALHTDTAFRTAALQGDRIALNASLQQKAAELGQSADSLRLNYTMGLLSDATQRLGIATNAQISREQLAQAGTQFQEDLIFKVSQLAQADAQFAAEYGLDAAKFNSSEDQRGFDNEYRLTQPAGTGGG